MNKKTKVDKDKIHKKKRGKAQRASKKLSFDEWHRTHRKALLVIYYSVAAIVIIVNASIILNNITVVEIVEREEPIYYQTEYIDDNTLELGTEEVQQEGKNGSKKVYYKERKKWLSGEILNSDYDSAGEEKEPTKKVVRRGTRRWQYMICSDGSYRYFTNEQMQDRNVGFTHKSEDLCAQNGQGTMMELDDVAPYNASGNASSYNYNYEHIKERILRYKNEEMEAKSKRREELNIDYQNANNCTNKVNNEYYAYVINNNLYWDRNEFNDWWSACMNDKGYSGYIYKDSFLEYIESEIDKTYQL